jgi:hypothetical protein
MLPYAWGLRNCQDLHEAIARIPDGSSVSGQLRLGPSRRPATGVLLPSWKIEVHRGKREEHPRPQSCALGQRCRHGNPAPSALKTDPVRALCQAATRVEPAMCCPAPSRSRVTTEPRAILTQRRGALDHQPAPRHQIVRGPDAIKRRHLIGSCVGRRGLRSTVASILVRQKGPHIAQTSGVTCHRAAYREPRPRMSSNAEHSVVNGSPLSECARQATYPSGRTSTAPDSSMP